MVCLPVCPTNSLSHFGLKNSVCHRQKSHQEFVLKKSSVRHYCSECSNHITVRQTCCLHSIASFISPNSIVALNTQNRLGGGGLQGQDRGPSIMKQWLVGVWHKVSFTFHLSFNPNPGPPSTPKPTGPVILRRWPCQGPEGLNLHLCRRLPVGPNLRPWPPEGLCLRRGFQRVPAFVFAASLQRILVHAVSAGFQMVPAFNPTVGLLRVIAVDLLRVSAFSLLRVWAFAPIVSLQGVLAFTLAVGLLRVSALASTLPASFGLWPSSRPPSTLLASFGLWPSSRPPSTVPSSFGSVCFILYFDIVLILCLVSYVLCHFSGSCVLPCACLSPPVCQYCFLCDSLSLSQLLFHLTCSSSRY